eukprot:CAMPEP_0171114378 /NCGR_PEP_ID=MMETSP0766_2-20121228/85207_1 /TAXON_ID=439317 /ORGANISM="Gambierdiscus australes, Strain CAWD 149" /LENGTH=110 /DNA_ID=CAMNT_0011576673 /DNA_START=25 /DNA_END=358 /DNA_ORIENTATION=-
MERPPMLPGTLKKCTMRACENQEVSSEDSPVSGKRLSNGLYDSVREEKHKSGLRLTSRLLAFHDSATQSHSIAAKQRVCHGARTGVLRRFPFAGPEGDVAIPAGPILGGA